MISEHKNISSIKKPAGGVELALLLVHWGTAGALLYLAFIQALTLANYQTYLMGADNGGAPIWLAILTMAVRLVAIRASFWVLADARAYLAPWQAHVAAIFSLVVLVGMPILLIPFICGYLVFYAAAKAQAPQGSASRR